MWEVMGLGDKKMYEIFGPKWYNLAFSVVEKKLKEKEIFDKLPKETKLFLELSPLRSIPRELIMELKTSIEKNKIFPREWEIVGSFRRELPTSRDVDIIAIFSDAEEKNILDNFVKNFDFKIYLTGPEKTSGFAFIDNKWIKLDIFKSSTKDYPFMLLYGTGSRDFNIAMRYSAKKKNWMLNQYELINLDTNRAFPGLKTEQDIFKKIGFEWKEPKNRNMKFVKGGRDAALEPI